MHKFEAKKIDPICYEPCYTDSQNGPLKVEAPTCEGLPSNSRHRGSEVIKLCIDEIEVKVHRRTGANAIEEGASRILDTLLPYVS